MSSPFYVPVSLDHTTLLLSDVQSQILLRFSQEEQAAYIGKVLILLNFFRSEIKSRRASAEPKESGPPCDDVPLIIHHTLPFNINSNAFVSPYNKLASWVDKLEASGAFANAPSDPHRPHYGVPSELVPPGGWGGKDEILIGKLQPNCFGSSDLLAYLRARGIRHVVLVGLTTMGSILSSARAGAELDFHVICVEDGIIDDDSEVHGFIMKRILPKFVDVVTAKDIVNLGKEKSSG
ncbi:Isochorismatase hydrolase [Fusarium agapanthi]|uniref:Isochorismatase hydrolase n=1 Tax=Fusarium agapanthi TaxID=1803897 RepID=A0A9P5B6F8_9HYPO|nr:Isochorismatase hydrolase [Fusarium agapanthi]